MANIVSVIIPTIECREKFLMEKCLPSVRNNDPNEVIVMVPETVMKACGTEPRSVVVPLARVVATPPPTGAKSTEKLGECASMTAGSATSNQDQISASGTWVPNRSRISSVERSSQSPV